MIFDRPSRPLTFLIFNSCCCFITVVVQVQQHAIVGKPVFATFAIPPSAPNFSSCLFFIVLLVRPIYLDIFTLSQPFSLFHLFLLIFVLPFIQPHPAFSPFFRDQLLALSCPSLFHLAFCSECAAGRCSLLAFTRCLLVFHSRLFFVVILSPFCYISGSVHVLLVPCVCVAIFHFYFRFSLLYAIRGCRPHSSLSLPTFTTHFFLNILTTSCFPETWITAQVIEYSISLFLLSPLARACRTR